MANALNLLTGIETVASAGTAVQFQTTNAFVRSIVITANAGNTVGEHIVVGDSNVVGALATRRGHPLAPGEKMIITAEGLNQSGLHGEGSPKMVNLKDLWVDSITSSDKVSWFAIR